METNIKAYAPTQRDKVKIYGFLRQSKNNGHYLDFRLKKNLANLLDYIIERDIYGVVTGQKPYTVSAISSLISQRDNVLLTASGVITHQTLREHRLKLNKNKEPFTKWESIDYIVPSWLDIWWGLRLVRDTNENILQVSEEEFISRWEQGATGWEVPVAEDLTINCENTD